MRYMLGRGRKRQAAISGKFTRFKAEMCSLTSLEGSVDFIKLVCV